MARLNGRRVWVTGGGRGIGRAIAVAMARQEADVAVSARTKSEIDSVAMEIRSLGVNAVAVVCDVMSFDAIGECVESIRSDLGEIDILVNNAGGGTGLSNTEGLSKEQIDDRLFVANVDLNLFSAYRASRAVLPGMIERGHGRIINIGSGYAKRSGGHPAYTAAKHGLIGLTRAMAAEVAEQGVTINCLCPGWTNTQLVDLEAMASTRRTTVEVEKTRIVSENLQKRILEPEELGPMATLLAADESAGITGQVISVDGGYKI
ncbi:MAG: SDR family NAD(P)-dependent oxidoreductase [Pseudomonadota bacterium]|nr:SDR family NAD(P)-dependent oxidoreductase [Pseudomonadota bacterium]